MCSSAGWDLTLMNQGRLGFHPNLLWCTKHVNCNSHSFLFFFLFFFCGMTWQACRLFKTPDLTHWACPCDLPSPQPHLPCWGWPLRCWLARLLLGTVHCAGSRQSRPREMLLALRHHWLAATILPAFFAGSRYFASSALLYCPHTCFIRMYFKPRPHLT